MSRNRGKWLPLQRRSAVAGLVVLSLTFPLTAAAQGPTGPDDQAFGGTARRRPLPLSSLAGAAPAPVRPTGELSVIAPPDCDTAPVTGCWTRPFWRGDGPPPSRETFLGGDTDRDRENMARAEPAAATMVTLPDGRILYWDELEGMEDATLLDTGLKNSRARILDLNGAEPRWTVPTPEHGTDRPPDEAMNDLGCADQVLLSDGTVLIASGSNWKVPEGGSFGIRDTLIFDPKRDTFRTAAKLHYGRWYPSLLTLADGRVVALSGAQWNAPDEPLVLSHVAPVVGADDPDTEEDEAEFLVRHPERYDPTTKNWELLQPNRIGLPNPDPETFRGLNKLDQPTLPLYPRVHMLPSGKVFFGGGGFYGTPPNSMAVDSPTWAVQRLFDPETATWRQLGVAPYGPRGNPFSVMLRLEPDDAGRYREATVLSAGGTHGISTGTVVASTVSELVTMRDDTVVGGPTVPKHPLAGVGPAGDPTQLRNPRWLGTGVVLPTGEVVAVNGGDLDHNTAIEAEAAVRTAELYDPRTNTWRNLSEGGRDRTYHSTAVLLRDGRVLVGGHSPLHLTSGHQHGPVDAGRLKAETARTDLWRDPSFEILSPPYLFRGERPVIEDAPARLPRPGRTFSVAMETPLDQVREVVLVRLGSVTHGWQADQRAVKLPLTMRDDSIRLTVPPSTVAPPGFYYLFVIAGSSDDPNTFTPSVARIVQVGR